MVGRTIAHLGGLHILVNNAGIELPKIETTEDEYDRVMNTASGKFKATNVQQT